MSIDAAKEVLLIEEQGLAAVRGRIGEEFVRAVSPSRPVTAGW